MWEISVFASADYVLLDLLRGLEFENLDVWNLRIWTVLNRQIWNFNILSRDLLEDWDLENSIFEVCNSETLKL